MSINYRLTPEVVFPVHFQDCARAIQYARLHAADFNIDPSRIGVGGSSAGGLTSFWLAFHNDLADPGNVDSVLRMSSRVRAVTCWSGQTSVDKRVVVNWIGPIVLQFTSYFGGAIFGIPADSMNTPAGYALQEQASPAFHLTSDDAPAWMYYSIVNPPTTSSEAIHHVNFGLRLKDKMDTLGIESVVLTPSYTGGITDSATSFLVKHLRESGPTAVREDRLPSEFFVHQNYPNPFNPATVIAYGLAKEGHVTLKVFNIVGQEVTTLVNMEQTAGVHQVQFDAVNLPSGVYFYRIQAGAFVQTNRMLLVK